MGWITKQLWVNYQKEQEIFNSVKHPDQLWCPPSLLFNGDSGHSHRSKVAGIWCWPFTSIL